MPLALRIDVDKPYGAQNLCSRVLSKLREDYGFAAINGFGFGDNIQEMADFLDLRKIRASWYFRLCTLPDKSILNKLMVQKHRVGWHLENSRSFEDFQNELSKFKTIVGLTPESFSKHGSGDLKLGRYHYAPYEPDKYLEWSKMVQLPFPSGNLATTEEILNSDSSQFFKGVFWLDSNQYRTSQYSLDWLLKQAKQHYVVMLGHSCHFKTKNHQLRPNLEYVIQAANETGIEWFQI